MANQGRVFPKGVFGMRKTIMQITDFDVMTEEDFALRILSERIMS